MLMTPQEEEDKINRTEGTGENPADTDEKERLMNETIPCCVHSPSRTHENTKNEDSKLMTPQEDEDKMNSTEVKRESPEGGSFENTKVSKSQSTMDCCPTIAQIFYVGLYVVKIQGPLRGWLNIPSQFTIHWKSPLGILASVDLGGRKLWPLQSYKVSRSSFKHKLGPRQWLPCNFCPKNGHCRRFGGFSPLRKDFSG